MAGDPRGHRRHRDHRAAGLARIQLLHQQGTPIACCLCGKPLDPFQPYNGGRNPKAPTIEHRQALANGGALFQSNGPDSWAHRGCQSRQGAELRNTRRQPAARINSRRW